MNIVMERLFALNVYVMGTIAGRITGFVHFDQE